uniref:Uncharacterized protein n=1 Tax=Arundo donax TaxID=35708 RepID=A0A0A9CS17_ARUDO
MPCFRSSLLSIPVHHRRQIRRGRLGRRSLGEGGVDRGGTNGRRRSLGAAGAGQAPAAWRRRGRIQARADRIEGQGVVDRRSESRALRPGWRAAACEEAGGAYLDTVAWERARRALSAAVARRAAAVSACWLSQVYCGGFRGITDKSSIQAYPNRSMFPQLWAVARS